MNHQAIRWRRCCTPCFFEVPINTMRSSIHTPPKNLPGIMLLRGNANVCAMNNCSTIHRGLYQRTTVKDVPGRDAKQEKTCAVRGLRAERSKVMFCTVCAFRVRVWESYRTYRSFGYGYRSVAELTEVPRGVLWRRRT